MKPVQNYVNETLFSLKLSGDSLTFHMWTIPKNQ